MSVIYAYAGGRDDGRVRSAMAATGPMQPLLTSGDGVGAAQQQNVVSEQLDCGTDRSSFQQTAWMASQLCLAWAAARLDASCSAGLSMLGGMLPAPPVVMARFGRHDASSHLVAWTGCRRIMKVPPVLLLRRMDATADHLGPVAAWADCVVPFAAFVGA